MTSTTKKKKSQSFSKLEHEREEKEQALKLGVDLNQELNSLRSDKASLTSDAETARAALEGAKIMHKDEKEKLEKKVAKLAKTVETKKEALSLGLTKYLKELKAREKADKEIEGLKSKIEENKYMLQR